MRNPPRVRPQAPSHTVIRLSSVSEPGRPPGTGFAQVRVWRPGRQGQARSGGSGPGAAQGGWLALLPLSPRRCFSSSDPAGLPSSDRPVPPPPSPTRSPSSIQDALPSGPDQGQVRLCRAAPRPRVGVPGSSSGPARNTRPRAVVVSQVRAGARGLGQDAQGQEVHRPGSGSGLAGPGAAGSGSGLLVRPGRRPSSGFGTRPPRNRAGKVVHRSGSGRVWVWVWNRVRPRLQGGCRRAAARLRGQTGSGWLAPGQGQGQAGLAAADCRIAVAVCRCRARLGQAGPVVWVRAAATGAGSGHAGLGQAPGQALGWVYPSVCLSVFPSVCLSSIIGQVRSELPSGNTSPGRQTGSGLRRVAVRLVRLCSRPGQAPRVRPGQGLGCTPARTGSGSDPYHRTDPVIWAGRQPGYPGPHPRPRNP